MSRDRRALGQVAARALAWAPILARALTVAVAARTLAGTTTGIGGIGAARVPAGPKMIGKATPNSDPGEH